METKKALENKYSVNPYDYQQKTKSSPSMCLSLEMGLACGYTLPILNEVRKPFR